MCVVVKLWLGPDQASKSERSLWIQHESRRAKRQTRGLLRAGALKRSAALRHYRFVRTLR